MDINKIKNIGALKKSTYKNRNVRSELRENLIRKIELKENIFPGILGYEDTIIPDLQNAILSKHDFILLGLRGQAKSRILRSFVNLLDDYIPIIASISGGTVKEYEQLASRFDEANHLVNGLEVDYDISDDGNSSTLRFYVEDGTEEIEIIGTHVIPEFPFSVFFGFVLMTSTVLMITKFRILKW